MVEVQSVCLKKEVDRTIFILRHSWWAGLKTMGKIYLFLSIFMLQKNPILRSQRMMLNIDEVGNILGKSLVKSTGKTPGLTFNLNNRLFAN